MCLNPSTDCCKCQHKRLEIVVLRLLFRSMLNLTPGPPFEIEMPCKGVLDFSAYYPRRGDSGGGVSTYASSSQEFFPDFGVPGGPVVPNFRQGESKKITLYYNGCARTPAVRE